MSSSLFSEIQRRLPDLSVPADEWVRMMMLWHFSKDTGCRYWLQRRQKLPFDPIADVTSVADLELFGLFDKSVLRTIPTEDLVPRAFVDRPRRVFETGGTSGPPCRIVDVTMGEYNVVIYRTMLDARNLSGGNVLAMTPSGPHAYGTFVSRLADTWLGSVFSIDFDPRWVKQLVRHSFDAAPYLTHLISQTRTLLETQKPSLLFTTSKLLKELVLALPRPLTDYGVRAVCTGGTSCSAEEEGYLRENFLAGVEWIDTYGNTLMGHALQGDPWAGHPRRAYYLPPPQAIIRIVDGVDWHREMPPGARGRVLLQTLHRDLFIPNLLERDSAVRAGPHSWFPFEGLAEIGPYVDQTTEAAIIEGVY